MKKLFLFAVVVAALYYGFTEKSLERYLPKAPARSTSGPRDRLKIAYDNRESNVQTQGRGKVVHILPDDNVGSRHQRFLLQLPSGQTLLIAHNIDLAKRVSGLQVGDTVEFYGEYEWNSKGGVLHWTHRDPKGRHVGGWLRHQGRTYQ
jgi:hypothetical protein